MRVPDVLPDAEMSGPLPQVDGETLTLYRRVLEMDVVDTAALEREFGPEEAQRVVRKLSEALLLRPVPGGMAVLRPDVAASTIIHPLETTIREAQRRIDQISGDFDRVMAVYRSTVEKRNQQEGLLDTVTDPATSRALVRERIAGARREVLLMCGTDPESEHRFELIPAVDGMPAQPGVRLCVLHQHAARYQPAVQDHAAFISSAGGQVRTIEKLWNHICIIDQETVFLFDNSGVVSVSQPTVAAAVTALFEQIWCQARPFHGNFVSRSEGVQLREDVQRAIVYFLAEGLRDESIARRIGVSVRTCRRHIAELLEEMGAESRFQAGYLTAKLGLLDSSPDGIAARIRSGAAPDGLTG
jgi:hypothetical protein